MDFKKEPKFPRLVLLLTILLVGVMFWFFSRGHSSSEQGKIIGQQQGANGELLTPLVDSVNATVTLAWNPNPEPDIAGYSLVYGLVPGVYTQQFPLTGVTPSTTVSISGLSSGTPYFAALRAQNTAGIWSQYSSELAFTTPSPSIVSGHILYCTTQAGVANITVVLTGDLNLTAVTDSTGFYSFTVTAGGSYTVTPIPPQPLQPGASQINTVDMLAAQRIFLGVGTAACPQAGDVNGSGRVDTADVVAIQRFVLGSTVGIANTGQYHFDLGPRNFQMWAMGDIE